MVVLVGLDAEKDQAQRNSSNQPVNQLLAVTFLNAVVGKSYREA